MNDLAVNTLADNITTSIATDMYNPYIVPYDYSNYTSITSAWSTKLETDSNELKINIKKFQIKFNFNL